jgi:hypothetical protein
MIHARKIGHVPEKLQIPQQSDYVTTWQKSIAEEQVSKRDSKLKAFVRSRISPESVNQISKALFFLQLMRNDKRWQKRSRLSNRELYLPVRQWDITTRRALEMAGFHATAT